MKLRRSLALAAATAAITPAVLLAAPAAHATGDETVSPTVSDSASAEVQPGPSDSTTQGTQDTTAPDDAASASDDVAPAASTSASSDASASSSASVSPSDSASVSASPSVSASESTGPLDCGDDSDVHVDKNLHTSLSGLPSKIVAGSGFHGFELNVKNTGGDAYQRVDLGVFAAQMDSDEYFIDTSHLTLQYKDPSSGVWTDISLDEHDEGAGYLGYTDVKAHESFSIDLRLAVDKSAPAGLGYAISIGMYADGEGNCVFSDDENSYYQFDILKAGSTPGEPGDAKPQGGHKPLPNKPSGNTEIEPQGHLAETGSSSVLPLIGLVGGTAVVAGAGAVFVVRRRRTAGPGTVA